jgi:DNA repair exonuclease SbcCD ATPase subunit
MKWIVQLTEAQVDAREVADALQSGGSSGRQHEASPVLVTRDSRDEVFRSMNQRTPAISIPAVLLSGEPVRPSDPVSAPAIHTLVSTGESDLVPTLTSPNFPPRVVVAKLVEDIDRAVTRIEAQRTSEAQHGEDDQEVAEDTAGASTNAAMRNLSSLVIGVALNSYASRNDIDTGKPLAPMLLGKLKHSDALPPSSPGRVRESHLELPFRPRNRSTDSHVEVRSLAEFDALIRELATSASFRSAAGRLSLCCNVTVFFAPSDPDIILTPTPVVSFSFWHLWTEHFGAFAHSLARGLQSATTGTPAMVGDAPRYAFAPLDAPADVHLGRISVTSRRGCDEYRELLASIDRSLDELRPVLARARARVQGANPGYPPSKVVAATFTSLLPESLQQRRDAASAAPGRPLQLSRAISPPGRRGTATVAGTNPNPADTTPSSPLLPHLGPDTDGDEQGALQALQAEKVRLVQSIADADAELERIGAALDSAERLEMAQREADGLVAEHDEADATFAILMERLKAEKAEKRRLEAEVERERDIARQRQDELRRARNDVARLAAEARTAEEQAQVVQEDVTLEEVELRVLEKEADRETEKAVQAARGTRERLEGERQRVLEARARLIDEANAQISKERDAAVTERRRRADHLEAELRRQRERLERAQNDRRAAQAISVELQTKVAQESALAQSHDRNARLAAAELQQTRRKHGDDVLPDRRSSLEAELRAVDVEVAELRSNSETVHSRAEETVRMSAATEEELTARKQELTLRQAEHHEFFASIFRNRFEQLLRNESDGRDAITDAQTTAVCAIRVDERLSWNAVLRVTEASVHVAGHSYTRRDIAAVSSRVSVLHDKILSAKNRMEIYEGRIRRAREDHQAIVNEYHEAHRQLLHDEKLAELETPNTLSEALEATRLENAKEAAIAKGTMEAQLKARKIRDALARAPIDPLSSVRPVVVPTVVDIYTRLQRLLRDARRRTHDANAETANIERTLRRVTREVDERVEIRSRVRQAVGRYEDRIDELEGQWGRATAELDSKSNRDRILREQLKVEYVQAQETVARHRQEDEARLREAYEAIDELKANVHQSTDQVQKLRDEVAAARRRNTPRNEEICRLELRRETERTRELDALLAQTQLRRGADLASFLDTDLPRGVVPAQDRTSRSASSAAAMDEQQGRFELPRGHGRPPVAPPVPDSAAVVPSRRASLSGASTISFHSPRGTPAAFDAVDVSHGGARTASSADPEDG